MSAEHPLRDAVEDRLEHLADAVKPHLRGWLHLGTFPLAVVAGAVLVGLSPTPQIRVATGVFAVTAALLFGISALYHRGTWSPRTLLLLKRFDHANIFLIIAGTYTPLSVMLLDGDEARTLLTLVWGGALAGVLFTVLWVSAPRWLYVPIYIALGWAAVFWLPEFAAGGGWGVLSLIVTGGLLYSVGALVYGLKRPNPSPRWFGFHEVFHALTVAAFLSHYVGVSLAAYGAAPATS